MSSQGTLFLKTTKLPDTLLQEIPFLKCKGASSCLVQCFFNLKLNVKWCIHILGRRQANYFSMHILMKFTSPMHLGSKYVVILIKDNEAYLKSITVGGKISVALSDFGFCSPLPAPFLGGWFWFSFHFIIVVRLSRLNNFTGKKKVHPGPGYVSRIWGQAGSGSQQISLRAREEPRQEARKSSRGQSWRASHIKNPEADAES